MPKKPSPAKSLKYSIKNLRIAVDDTPVNGDKKLLQLVQKAAVRTP